jgi:hypothetical protein
MREIARSILTVFEPLAVPAILAGTVLLLAALVWLVVSEWRKEPGKHAHASEKEEVVRGPGWRWLVLLVVVGAILRLWGLDSKTISHPEVHIPGIPLPAEISAPPPRLDLATLLEWNFYTEPHPIGYYVGMFGWTTVFGTSLTALRLPSALLGILSIPILFLIGARIYDRTTGLIAAAFLAVHGFHIYWSQMARMYVPECFLGLAATWLLLELLNDSRPRGLLEAGYVIAIVAGFSTEWFFWPLVAGHMFVVLVHCAGTPGFMRRMLYFQCLAIVIGGYVVTQAFATHHRAGSGGSLSVGVIRDFLSFGFLTEADTWSQPERAFPTWFLVGAIVLSILLLVRGLGARPVRPRVEEREPPDHGPLYLAAAGMSTVMVGLALRPDVRSLVLIAAFPFAAMAVFPVAGFVAPRLAEWARRFEKRSSLIPSLSSPIAILAFVPVSLVFVASALQPIIVSRALLVFVPLLLLLLAAGVRSLSRRPVSAVVMTATLVTFLTAAVLHFRAVPTSPNDYAAIAAVIRQHAQPGDVILVPPRKWYVTPLFYYLDPAQLVSSDYATTVARLPHARVWLAQMEGVKRDPEINAALSELRVVEEVSVTGTRVQLLARVNYPR